MIKYNLKCKNNHEFESWFADSKEFDKLNKRKMLECIFCHSKKIEKSIMSPRIGTQAKNKFKSNTSITQVKKLKKDQQNFFDWACQ